MEGFQECERDETERRTDTTSWVPLLLSSWSLIQKVSVAELVWRPTSKNASVLIPEDRCPKTPRWPWLFLKLGRTLGD